LLKPSKKRSSKTRRKEPLGAARKMTRKMKNWLRMKRTAMISSKTKKTRKRERVQIRRASPRETKRPLLARKVSP